MPSSSQAPVSSKAQSSAATAWKIIVAILVAVLILVLLAEFGARYFIGQQLRASFREDIEAQGIEMTEDPEVSFGSSPVLFGLLGGKLSEVNIDTPSTLQQDAEGNYKGMPASHVHMESMALESGEAEFLRTRSELPDEYLTHTIQEGLREQLGGAAFLGELVVSDISTDHEAGTITVKFLSGAANLTLRPLVGDNGNVSFDASEAKILGFSLPEGAADGIANSLNQNLREATGGQLDITAIEFNDHGLVITLEGRNVNPSDMSKELNATPGANPGGAGKGAGQGAGANSTAPVRKS